MDSSDWGTTIVVCVAIVAAASIAVAGEVNSEPPGLRQKLGDLEARVRTLEGRTVLLPSGGHATWKAEDGREIHVTCDGTACRVVTLE